MIYNNTYWGAARKIVSIIVTGKDSGERQKQNQVPAVASGFDCLPLEQLNMLISYIQWTI